MAQTNELRGYALKQRLGLVPHRYPRPELMRGVQPPIRPAEARRFQMEAADRRAARVPRTERS